MPDTFKVFSQNWKVSPNCADFLFPFLASGFQPKTSLQRLPESWQTCMSQRLEAAFHSLPLTFQSSSGLSTIPRITDFIYQSVGLHLPLIFISHPWEKEIQWNFAKIYRTFFKPEICKWKRKYYYSVLIVLFFCGKESCQLQGQFCTVHHSFFAFFKLFISVWMEKIPVYHCGFNTVRFPKRAAPKKILSGMSR